jgi:hypothetical protein
MHTNANGGRSPPLYIGPWIVYCLLQWQEMFGPGGWVATQPPGGRDEIVPPWGPEPVGS